MKISEELGITEMINFLGFVEDEPDEEDPTGELYYEDLLELFPGELIHYEKRGSAYNDIVIRIQK